VLLFLPVVTPSYVKSRIEAGLDDRQRGLNHKPELIDKVFRQTSAPDDHGEHKMPSDRLVPALRRLSISIDQGEAQEFRRTKGGSRDFVSRDEFRRAATKQWDVDVWAQSLPLAPMLADALPECTGCNRLRAVCSLTEVEIRAIADGYREGLQRLLTQHVGYLRTAYEALDKLVAMPRNGAAQKFELSAMRCGKLQDFHAGLQKRIGKFCGVA
jgi:hypothetical protein